MENMYSSSGSFYLSQVEVCSDLSCYFHFGRAAIDTVAYVFMRKVDSSSNEIWTKFYSGSPPTYGFALNNAQTNVFALLVTGSNLYVLKAATSDGMLSGSFVQTGSMYCGNYYCSITTSTDDSVLYIGGENTAPNGTICKLQTSSLASMNCYQITNTGYPEPFVFIQTDQLYFSTFSSGSTSQLFMKVNIATPTINWQKAVACGSASCQGYSRSTFSSSYSLVFTLFTMNSATYLISFYSASGNVYGNRYVSYYTASSFKILSINGDKLYVGYMATTYYFAILNLTDSIINSYQFATGINLFDMGFISTNNQLIFAGTLSNMNMYILISPESLLTANTDCSETTNVLSVTSSVALLPSPTTIASISSAVAYSTGLYNLSPSSFIMVGGTASPSDVVYHLDDITISNINSNSYYAIPEVLTCSISGATSIYFSYSSDKNNPVPSWASVDSTNNKLLFNTPSITSDTSYSFTLAVNTSQDSTLFYSNVYVNVKYVPVVCTVPNCSTCSQTNGSICTTCNSGYQLSADYQSCTQTSSGSASQVGLIIILASAGVSSLLVLAMSAINYTSPQGFWMVINHFQLLILLLLTEAYFPEIVLNFFAGVKLFNCSFNFIPVFDMSFFRKYNNFNFSLNFMNIDIVGLSAGSVIINNSNFIISLFCIITLHILFICFEKCTRRRFSRFKFYRKAMKMTFKFFTLAVYIRTVLEAYQYLLICSVYEVDFFSTNSIDQCISIVFAFLLLFFCIKFFGIIVCKTYWQNPHLKDLDTKAFKELFEGIKITRTAKWFNTMLVLRRMLLIIFLICFRLLSIYIKVGYVVLVQAICLGYLMISNPLIELKFSIVNFIDEIEFLGLTCMLFVYNKKSDWTSRAESVFMYSIAGCNRHQLIPKIICLEMIYRIILLTPK